MTTLRFDCYKKDDSYVNTFDVHVNNVNIILMSNFIDREANFKLIGSISPVNIFNLEYLKLTWLAQYEFKFFNKILYHNKRHLLIELDNGFVTLLSDDIKYNRDTKVFEIVGTLIQTYNRLPGYIF